MSAPRVCSRHGRDLEVHGCAECLESTVEVLDEVRLPAGDLEPWARVHLEPLPAWQQELAARLVAGEQVLVSWPRSYGKRQFRAAVDALDRALEAARAEGVVLHLFGRPIVRAEVPAPGSTGGTGTPWQ